MSDLAPTATPAAPTPSGLLAGYLLGTAVLVLAWPGPNPVAGDFATSELTAAGAAALVSVPLVLWLLWRRPLPVHGFLALFIALLLPSQFQQVRDPLELDRAMTTFSVAVMVATGAAALGAEGRRVLLRALLVASILLTLKALMEGAPGWGGVLGNSGELSGAALPGALVGGVVAARERGPWRWTGGAALVLFFLHALLAPVLAGLAVLVAVGFGAALVGGRAGRAWRIATLTLGLAALAGMAWVRLAPGDTAEPAAAEAAAPATSFGGFEVRRRIWQASTQLFFDAPLAGVGLGQFAVAFPEVRDPEERRLSDWDGRIEQTTEVENPHSDWLLPWLEGGLVAGFAWWVFLVGLFGRALVALRREESADLAAGAAGLGLLLAAAVNAPLLYNPVASLSAFAVFGLLAGPLRRAAKAARSLHFARYLTPGLALLFLLGVPTAWQLWSHGRALARLSDTTSTTAREQAVADALAARPDSVVARTLEARLLEGDGKLQEALVAWNRVLDLRPLRFEAHMQRGVVLARLERLADAREAFARAAELKPEHVPLVRNRVRCFAESGWTDEALAQVDRLEELGAYDATWLLELGAELVLRGLLAEAEPILARSDERFIGLTGEQAWALEKEYRRAGQKRVADAFRTLAQITFGRDQAAEEAWDDARRSYFQALRVQRDHVSPAGPVRTRLEHAAALWNAGREAEAREALVEVEAGPRDWASLPEWAGEALFMMGYGVERDG